MPTDTPPAPSRAVLVTGGASGIGLAIVLGFLRQGRDVYVLSRRGGRDTDELDRLVGQHGVARPTLLAGDVTDRVRLQAVGAELKERGVDLGIVVASAGTNTRELALDVADDAVKHMIDVNLYGVFATFVAFAPSVLERPGGRFIAISSLSAVHGQRLRVPYAATKAGVSGLVRGLAVEWGPSGATVNAIAPGIIETPLTSGYMRAHPERAQAGLDHTPVGRLGTVEDVAGMAMYLASGQAAFVNGQTMLVDGGMSAGSSWW